MGARRGENNTPEAKNQGRRRKEPRGTARAVVFQAEAWALKDTAVSKAW